MYRIEFFDSAMKDLQEISIYISLDNPFQSKKVLESIETSINYLQEFPYLWKERKDWLRELISKHKYRVFYKVENEVVYIISIFKYKDFI